MTDQQHGDGNKTGQRLECPDGHPGPWRFVETIEVWREVLSVDGDEIVTAAYYQSGPGYDDGDPDSAYLECRAEIPGSGKCTNRVEISEAMNIIWE